jgi:NAD(P)H-hydrate epimerase
MTALTSLYRAAQLRELDRRAIEQGAIPGSVLMARAGAAAFQLLRARWPRARRIAVLCGLGNNGGDGYVVARLAQADGLDVSVFSVGASDKVKGEAAEARSACTQAGVSITPYAGQSLDDAEVIVDALLGIGLERPVTGAMPAAIDAINRAKRPVLAIDIPSGLSADTGAVMGAAVRAETTISFIALKAGLFTGRGSEQSGEVFFNGLGVPPSIYEGIVPVARRLTDDTLHGLLPRRVRHAHKGDFGRVLVVGGAPGMPGAARLCGEAAYRCGAGMVTLATHPQHTAAIKPQLERATVVALGPGLGRGAWGKQLFTAALAARRPLVIDADGLYFFLAHSRKQRADWVLTPHAGEAARLLGCTADEIERDRFATVRAITEKFGGVCVLKGAGTLIAAQGEPTVYLCDRGNPGMASGGMGDVLTGVIAALRAQGLNALDAARLGVWVHATAGDAAAEQGGEIGLVASDVLGLLRAELNRLA